MRTGLNYTGRKGDLMDQIKPYLPEIKILGEPFCGSCEFSINVQADKYILNDINTKVVELLVWFRKTSVIQIRLEIDSLIQKYKLSKTNKQGYLALREDYNSNPTCAKFYTLIAHSFSNQIRFNQKGEFNLPFGKRTFNKRMKSNLYNFLYQLQGMNVEFRSHQYFEFCWLGCDFLYCDPPYSLGLATYNEHGKWGVNDDLILFDFLDSFPNKWMLSNVTENKGFQNEPLIEWMENYNYTFLKNNYKRSNYQRKEGDSKEVLVWNY